MLQSARRPRCTSHKENTISDMQATERCVSRLTEARGCSRSGRPNFKVVSRRSHANLLQPGVRTSLAVTFDLRTAAFNMPYLRYTKTFPSLHTDIQITRTNICPPNIGWSFLIAQRLMERVCRDQQNRPTTFRPASECLAFS